MDTPIKRTVTKSLPKTKNKCLTEINSRYYGLSLKRTLTWGPCSVCHEGSWLESFRNEIDCSSWKRGGDYCFLLFSCPSSSLRHNCAHVFLSQTNSSDISFLFLHKFFFFFKFLSRKKELSLFNRGLSKGKSISNRNNKVFKCMHLPVTSQQGSFAKCWMTVICRMNDHQYRTSAVVPQTSFRRETSGGITKYQLFSQARAQDIHQNI